MSPEEAEAYRRPVLDALGADDPYQVQAGELDAWRLLVDTAGEALRARPEPEEWSALELLGHMTDSELVTAGRYRWTLAEDEPPLLGFDQEAWAVAFDHATESPDELLDIFGGLRRANLRLWRRTPPEARSRVGLHAERGPESYELLFRLQAGHGRMHLAQAERAVAAARDGRAERR